MAIALTGVREGSSGAVIVVREDRATGRRTPQSCETPRLDQTFQALQALAAEGFVIRGMACRVVNLRRDERLAGDRPIEKPLEPKCADADQALPLERAVKQVAEPEASESDIAQPKRL